MALALDKDHGTLTATAGGTEDTILTETDSGIYVLTVNLKNLANGERVCIRAYAKVLTGDTNPGLVFEQEYMHKQGDAAAPGSVGSGPIIVKSPPIESPFSLVFTIQQLNGTARDFAWRSDQLA
jgi:hypothetical protein